MKAQRLLLFFVLAAAPISAFAQVNINVTKAIESAKAEFSDIKNRSNELELMKRDADRANLSSSDQPKKFPEIKEDFERIQIINSDLLQANVIKDNPDYPIVYKTASEIRKRAARLKSNLFVSGEENRPVKKDKSKEESAKLQALDLKTLSVALDNAINDFVHNNMFQNILVINPDDLHKAENDLETVIKLSSEIERRQPN